MRYADVHNVLSHLAMATLVRTEIEPGWAVVPAAILGRRYQLDLSRIADLPITNTETGAQIIIQAVQAVSPGPLAWVPLCLFTLDES